MASIMTLMHQPFSLLSFPYDLKKDCDLAYNSFNTDFDFEAGQFYALVKGHFDENFVSY